MFVCTVSRYDSSPFTEHKTENNARYYTVISALKSFLMHATGSKHYNLNAQQMIERSNHFLLQCSTMQYRIYNPLDRVYVRE
jgi:hypothetical protein